MSHDMAVLLAKRFIQRRDVKAVQRAFPDKIIYSPDREMTDRNGNLLPGPHMPLGFCMEQLYMHLDGKATFGHYLLDSESNCRMFAFDLDLNKTGSYLPESQMADASESYTPVEFDPREAWLDRAHPSRPWQKMQMGALARKLVSGIQNELDIPCAAAYSGSKGIHVYGFTGPQPAALVREAAMVVLDSTDEWEPAQGRSKFKHKLTDGVMGYPNFSLEVFPKQDSLEGKDLGNLMRLPLGRNLRTQDPTFFLDLTTPVGVMQPHADPVRLLTNGNPYE